MSIKIFVSDWSWSDTRQKFNTIIKNLECMMDESNISSSSVSRLQWKCAKEVTGTLEEQLLYKSHRSVEQKKKYAVITNLGAESDFAALDSNFRWLKGSTTSKQSLISRLDRLYNVFLNFIKPNGFQSSSYLYQTF